ncbi:hypothetical protein AURDEDRAFT_127598 [Auricularia subglabra TFB-10046 SS5]|nr:hypothetical protein AURDEDRAFT_127598 [Auricularia subglabra TFB-10046 SS5]
MQYLVLQKSFTVKLARGTRGERVRRTRNHSPADPTCNPSVITNGPVGKPEGSREEGDNEGGKGNLGGIKESGSSARATLAVARLRTDPRVERTRATRRAEWRWGGEAAAAGSRWEGDWSRRGIRRFETPTSEPRRTSPRARAAMGYWSPRRAQVRPRLGGLGRLLDWVAGFGAYAVADGRSVPRMHARLRARPPAYTHGEMVSCTGAGAGSGSSSSSRE